MLKYVVLLHRKEGMTFEEFEDYWMNEHVPIASSIPEVRKYVTSVPEHPEEADYDGVAELYFDDEADFEAAMGDDRTSEAARRSGEDAPNFIGDSEHVLVRETVQVDETE